MAKELPYFRFYPSEWLEGDITLEKLNCQGLFIQVCAYYWKKDCKIYKKFFKNFHKRLGVSQATVKTMLNTLVQSGIIKVDENERVIIDFLDEQYVILSAARQQKVDAGRSGGQASLKHRSSYKDNNKEKDKEYNRISMVIIDYFNKICNKNFKHVESNLRVIRARLKEGYSEDDCKKVIRIKNNQWKDDEKQKQFIRIETFFRASKFQSYSNEEEIKNNTKIKEIKDVFN